MQDRVGSMSAASSGLSRPTRPESGTVFVWTAMTVWGGTCRVKQNSQILGEGEKTADAALADCTEPESDKSLTATNQLLRLSGCTPKKSPAGVPRSSASSRLRRQPGLPAIPAGGASKSRRRSQLSE